jgi:hypothetical protein
LTHGQEYYYVAFLGVYAGGEAEIEVGLASLPRARGLLTELRASIEISEVRYR